MKPIDIIKKMLKIASPIMIGYFPIAMAFGILSKSNGLDLIETTAFSLILYAGASQFIGVSMLAMGSGFSEIVIATFLLNFRHFFMSASLSTKLKNNKSRLRPFIAFGVTDEVFSLLSFNEEALEDDLILGVEVLAYSSWVVGSVMGYILGNFMPMLLQMSMGIGLYAMFIAIIVPELKKDHAGVALFVLSGIVNTLLSYFTEMPQGWCIIISIMVASVTGVIVFDKRKVNNRVEDMVCEVHHE